MSGTSISSIGAARKSFKKSSLRQSIAAVDLTQDGDDTVGDGNKDAFGASGKSMLGRSSSMKKKSKASSRLSFGAVSVAGQAEDEETFTPKKSTLGRRIVESNALRQSISSNRIPIRDNEDVEEERPKYSKDYINELKSSTPSRPISLDSHATVEDEQTLDTSELEGATIVTKDSPAPPTSSHIPTDSEIREKKVRRARLAQSQDFISLTDDGPLTSSSQLSLLTHPKKPESRLVRDDEDFAEGFDSFVNDGRISLGKKAEREAKRRQRKEIADMIDQAEGSGSSESDDSEAERRAAYESAQRRAGMDGLARPEEGAEAATQMLGKITPLPALGECIKKLKETLGGMEKELRERKRRKDELERENEEIGRREVEVQRLLVEAGQRLQALKADADVVALGTGSARDMVEGHKALAGQLGSDRGLESFGGTPVGGGEVNDVG